MQEIWKQIDGFPNYEVSNMGCVRSISHKDKWGRVKGGHVLKPQFDGRKCYLHVGLYKNGKVTIRNVHRLVAMAFLENPANYEEINHKDEDKTNNAASNLEWCTHRYNSNYGGKLHSTRGEKNPLHKISYEDAVYILKNHKCNGGKMRNKELAEKLNIATTTVSGIAHRRRWRHADSM